MQARVRHLSLQIQGFQPRTFQTGANPFNSLLEKVNVFWMRPDTWNRGVEAKRFHTWPVLQGGEGEVPCSGDGETLGMPSQEAPSVPGPRCRDTKGCQGRSMHRVWCQSGSF